VAKAERKVQLHPHPEALNSRTKKVGTQLCNTKKPNPMHECAHTSCAIAGTSRDMGTSGSTGSAHASSFVATKFQVFMIASDSARLPTTREQSVGRLRHADMRTPHAILCRFTYKYTGTVEWWQCEKSAHLGPLCGM